MAVSFVHVCSISISSSVHRISVVHLFDWLLLLFLLFIDDDDDDDDDEVDGSLSSLPWLRGCRVENHPLELIVDLEDVSLTHIQDKQLQVTRLPGKVIFHTFPWNLCVGHKYYIKLTLTYTHLFSMQWCGASTR